jgi:hypothetical protein
MAGLELARRRPYESAMSLYHLVVAQPHKMLANLEKWLETAAAHAQKKSFDVNVLLAARLAPDQFALVRQVQTACDTAKLTAARVSAKEAPKHPDTEQTMDQLRERVRSVVAYLDTFTEADFAGAGDRDIDLAVMPGKVARGDDYVREFGTANFYFHTCMTYAILRHNGVELGKRDYLGSLQMRDK